MRRSSLFKACRNCHYLVPKKVSICPICGSKSFSDRWRGLVIILDTSSLVAKLLNISKEGSYAIKVL